MSILSERLRAILNTPGPKPPSLSGLTASRVPSLLPDLGCLDGQWCEDNGLSCFVVERRRDPETRYGSEPLKTMAARLFDASGQAALLGGGGPARPPFVFFDLETTGLSGGAGTYAFLVGCGTFDDEGGFLTRQFVLARHADERQLLQLVATELSQAGALVSFNGKSFDAPLIETRYLFHRLEWTGGDLPHIDVLHPARQFWGASTTVRLQGPHRSPGGGGQPDRGSCSLVALEEQLLGARRTGDVQGFEIPTRYFQFVRTGDARPLAAVLEHNRLDLLSLAGLTARLLDLIRIGPGAATHAREALALGRVYARSGMDDRAREAFQRATIMGARPIDSALARADASIAYTDAAMASIKIDALRALAFLSRRARRYEEAAACWRELLEMPACPPHFSREAGEALAIHHEHRVRDLHAARTFALRSLDAHRPAWNEAVQHRLARIQRKIEKSQVSRLEFEAPHSERLRLET